MKSIIATNTLYSLMIVTFLGLVNTLYPLCIGLFFNAEIMGHVSLILSWIILLSIPISNGIAPAITRFLAANSSDIINFVEGDGIKLTLIYGFSLAVILPIFPIFFNFNVISSIVIYIAVFSNIIHTTFRKSFQGQELFNKLFYKELISFAIFIPLSFLCIYLFKILNDISYLFILFFPPIFFNIIFIALIFKKIRRYISQLCKFKSKKVSNILRYSILVGIGSLFSLGLSQAQIVISDLYLNDFDLGVLGFWNTAMAPFSLLAVAIGAMLLSRISNIQRNSEKISKEFVNKTNWALSLVALPLFILLGIITKIFPSYLEIISFYKYNMIKYWPIFLYFLLSSINMLLMTISISYLSSSEKLVILLPILSLMKTLFVLMLWFLLVPSLEIFGFALGIGLGDVFLNISLHFYLLIKTKMKIGLHIVFNIVYMSVFFPFFIFNNYKFYIPLIMWGLISIPLIIIGFKIMRNILTKWEFSQRY